MKIIKDGRIIEPGPGCKKLNPNLFAAGGITNGTSSGETPQNRCPRLIAYRTARRIRQSHRPLLNKLESEWLRELEWMWPNSCIYKQALRWKLGNSIWYKPDFAAFIDGDNPYRLTCWEVKGPHVFRGGFENLKVAAGLYPEVRWILVWKDNGEWHQQQVLQ